MQVLRHAVLWLLRPLLTAVELALGVAGLVLALLPLLGALLRHGRGQAFSGMALLYL